MIVIGGSASGNLAKELANELGCDCVPASTQIFPDGECYTKVDLETLEGQDVVIVQNTFPDNKLVEALLIEDAVRSLNPKSVTLVVPYFGYARQDRVFNKGEPESAKVMCRVLALGCDRMITVDIHKENILEALGKPYRDVKAAPVIGKYFEDKGIDMVLSPDIGAAGRAKIVGETMGLPHDHLQKTRLSGTEVRIAPATMDVKGKRILIVDDMVSTGGTIIAASNALVEAGADSVTVACTHGVFANNALDRFEDSKVDDVLCCNTLENPVSKISVAGIVAGAVREALDGEW